MTIPTLEKKLAQVKELEVKHEEIAAKYREALERYSAFSSYEIAAAIAEEYGMTTEGVRYVLTKKGLYQKSNKRGRRRTS